MELFEAIVYGLGPIKIGRTFNERGGMKKDFQKNMVFDILDDEISSKLTLKKSMVRAGWTESSKAIAREGDDYLRLGDFPNPDDQELEW